MRLAIGAGGEFLRIDTGRFEVAIGRISGGTASHHTRPCGWNAEGTNAALDVVKQRLRSIMDAACNEYVCC